MQETSLKKSDALPDWFDPVEMYLNGEIAETPNANDFAKHELLSKLTDEANERVMAVTPREQIYIDVHPNTFIEVGSWMGANAIMMAAHDTLRSVYCVDTWKGGHDTLGAVAAALGPKQLFTTFCNNCRDYLWKQIFPCVGSSQTYAAVWPWKAVAVFVDADHTYESCKADLEAWWPVVAEGGILIGHDYQSFPDVTRAADEFGYDGTEGELFWKVKE